MLGYFFLNFHVYFVNFNEDGTGFSLVCESCVGLRVAVGSLSAGDIDGEHPGQREADDDGRVCGGK